jgi:hypothetical protein
MGAAVDGERSIASVFHDVVGNLGRIVRAEVRLAKVEVAEEMAVAAQATGGAAKRIVAGVAVGQLALGFFLLFVLRLLEAQVATWAAALLVAAAAGCVAGVLLATGLKQLKGVNLLPSKGLESPTENGR